MTTVRTPSPDDTAATLSEQLLAATRLLESVAADPQLLDELAADDRARLQQAVARIYHPDPVALEEPVGGRTQRAGTPRLQPASGEMAEQAHGTAQFGHRPRRGQG